MAKFVNFKKRGITLPKGCKDLAELLGKPAPAEIPIVIEHPTPRLRESARIETLRPGELPTILPLLFDSALARREVTLLTPNEREMIGLWWNEPLSGVAGTFAFFEDDHRAQEAREFFADLGKTAGPPPSTIVLSEDFEVARWTLHFELLAGSALELNGFLYLFFNQFLKLPSDAELQCVMPRRIRDAGPAPDDLKS